MVVYKAFRVGRTGNLLSLIVKGKALTKYKFGEWNMAPRWLEEFGYGPLAFIDIDDLRRYTEICFNLNNIAIVKCEADDYTVPKCQLYFNALKNGKFIPCIAQNLWPKGTVMVGKIKPIKVIEWHSKIKQKFTEAV